ncbi:conserved Plasmodium protein, unknown function [Babesia microti strain RI]|uniref:Uncharacterized protein n=1 Tax=Babesia microti (strain RI) TaxID=1133968 RepID=A0A1R4AAN5_BABMR|nr:conserved Plasmodium protein, unknown function [Babesia microti strain RI]SJK86024.1 conserved Plasmodium protein, unknown function [Babesia microti strain RI]|eukprot:XP_021338222.1 conserved Plasmodium protein, unknown function [Babesia microti strain RI]
MGVRFLLIICIINFYAISCTITGRNFSLCSFVSNGVYKGVHKRTRKRSPKRTRKRVPSLDSNKRKLSNTELRIKSKRIESLNAKKRRKNALEKRKSVVMEKKDFDFTDFINLLWEEVKGDTFSIEPTVDERSVPLKSCELNIKLHTLVKHRYADETITDIYVRLANYFKISPKVLYREICAITGKYGCNIIKPSDYEESSDMNPYIQSLRRAKFEIYTLIGRKMLRYALTCLTRYIRLGIPPEVRYRYVYDILSLEHVSSACDLYCNHIDIFPITRYDQIYPDRVDFRPCEDTTDIGGISDQIFYTEIDKSKGWSPSLLVDNSVFSILSDKMKCQLVYLSAALHPEYTLQIVKNVAFVAGYKNESELLRKFAFNNKFTSRGAKSYILKLSEESAANHIKEKIKSSPLSNRADRNLESIHKPLVWKSLDRRTSLRRLKKRLHKIFEEEEAHGMAKPSLWLVLKQQIDRRILEAPRTFYKQVKHTLLGTRNMSSRSIVTELIDRGFDPPCRSYSYINRKERVKIARKMEVWADKEITLPPNGLKTNIDYVKALSILDAAASAAGYKSIRHLLALVAMLAKPKTDKISRRIRQPGEIGQDNELKIKHFAHKLDGFN